MLVMTIMRALFITCVPLFLTLSGYLLYKKELTVKYYSRITKIILTYVLASFACMGYSMIVQQQPLSIKTMVLKLLDFSGAPYSWYIEMYLGLFLLIPFLNILYNNIPSQKHKLCLVITFIVLTSLPSVINEYNLYSLSWWAMPSATEAANKIIPSWWTGIYPVTYYFIGCYLREYGLNIKKSLNIILIVGCTLFSGIYSCWRSYKSTFIWGSWCGYQSLFNVVLTVLIFVFFINLNYDKVPAKLSRFIQKISGLCLGGYLVSWIFDSVFYPILLAKIPTVQDRLEYYLIIVPVVFISSLVLSYFISVLQMLLEILIDKTTKLLTKKRNSHQE